jgi:hypothetical protein
VKFRGLMIGVKYDDVIGIKKSLAWKFILGTYKKMSFSTNHIAVFHPDHQTTECRHPTVRATVVDPPIMKTGSHDPPS